jgi:glycine oxidase
MERVMSNAKSKSADVIVIGGGVVGCMLAYDLAAAGLQVELLEKGDLAREASAASAGIISAPSRDLGPRTPLGLMAFDRYPTLLRDVQAQAGRRIPSVKSGRIEVASDAQSLRQIFDWQREHALAVEWLSLEQIVEIEPAANTDTIEAGVFARDSFGLSLRDFCLAVASAAETLGAVVHRYTPVYKIEVESDSSVRVGTAHGDRLAGTVIVAAGPWCDSLLAGFGLPKISVPVRGEMMRLSDLPEPIRHVMSGFGGYIVPQEDGSCHVGATEIWSSGFDKRVTAAGMQFLIDLARAFAPSLLDGNVDRIWSGLRPGSTDQEPIIGPLPANGNVWLATGHFRSGAQLSPATSMLVTQSLTSGTLAPELEPFAVARLGT